MPAKTLTLPNGATAEIIAPNHFILLQAGSPPRSLKQGANEPGREFTDAELRWIVSHQKILLTRCVSSLRYPDGRAVRLVDKPWDQTAAEDELSLESLDQASADFLAVEINKIRQEAADAAAIFRPDAPKAKPGGSDNPGSPGTPLPMSAQPDSFPAGG